MSSAGTIVVFDLGGVLVRICRSWREGCAAAGLDVRAGTEGEAMIARRRELSAAYQEGRLTCAEFFEQVSLATGGAYSAAEVARIHDAWLIGLYDGAEALVEELVEAGVATGVLSNTNHRHWARMRSDYRPLGRIAHAHASHLLRASKPNEEIYRLFEDRVRSAPSEIIFFDDLEENVASAAMRGWCAHQIDYAGDTAAQMRGVLREAGVLR